MKFSRNRKITHNCGSYDILKLMKQLWNHNNENIRMPNFFLAEL